MRRHRRKNKQKKIIIISAVCLVCLMTVGYAAFNTSLNVNVKGNIVDKSRIIKSWTSSSNEDFHTDFYRENIVSATFLDTSEIPSNARENWDVSADNKKGVMAWVVESSTETGKYDLFIGAKNGVIANEDSSWLFANFPNIISIEFNNNYDTSSATNMSHMFQSSVNLISLDLSCFDTRNVTNMSLMFNSWEYYDNPMKLEEITFGKNFDTSNVTNMYGMFAACTKIKSLDLSNFNTSNVTDMHDMFSGCNLLESLNVNTFNTNNVSDMGGMFYDCYALTELNLCSFNTNKVTNMKWIFRQTNSMTKIKVGSNWTTANADTTGMFDSSSVSSVTAGECPA